MRISTIKTDPGHANFAMNRQCEVHVDGRVLTNCFMADEEAGEASYYVYDQLGNPVIVGCELLRRTVTGVVVKIVDITPAIKLAVDDQVTPVLKRLLQHPLFEGCAPTEPPPDKIAVAADVMVRDLRT